MSLSTIAMVLAFLENRFANNFKVEALPWAQRFSTWNLVSCSPAF